MAWVVLCAGTTQTTTGCSRAGWRGAPSGRSGTRKSMTTSGRTETAERSAVVQRRLRLVHLHLPRALHHPEHGRLQGDHVALGPDHEVHDREGGAVAPFEHGGGHEHEAEALAQRPHQAEPVVQGEAQGGEVLDEARAVDEPDGDARAVRGGQRLGHEVELPVGQLLRRAPALGPAGVAGSSRKISNALRTRSASNFLGMGSRRKPTPSIRYLTARPSALGSMCSSEAPAADRQGEQVLEDRLRDRCRRRPPGPSTWPPGCR